MNSRERILAALRLEIPDKVPFMESRVDPSMQRALMGIVKKSVDEDDEITGLSILSGPELNEAIGLDNLQVRFLPPIFAEFRKIDNRVTPTDPLIRTRDDLVHMEFPDPGSPKIFRNADEVIRRGKGKYAVGASVRIGVSAAYMSMGLESFSYAIYDDPGFLHTVIGRYADWTIAIVRQLRSKGVDFIWTFDDIADKTGPLVSPQTFRNIFLPHMERVGDAIRSEGFKWVLHSDGNVMPLMDDLIELGVDGLHPIEPGAMQIEFIKEQYGNQICLVGNIDLHYTLTRGTPEEVEKEVKNRIEVVGKGGGYIISSANSLASYCKVDNVRAMIEAIHKYRNYD